MFEFILNASISIKIEIIIIYLLLEKCMSFNKKGFINTATPIVSCLFTNKDVIKKQMISHFTCNDVAIGHTIMMGFTTAGWVGIGVVKRIIPGVCFEIEQKSSQISMLWSGLMIHPATVKKYIKDYTEPCIEPVSIKSPPKAPQLRRTDSGADYGFHGYPDCEFWSKQGIMPLFVATCTDYSHYRYPDPPIEIRKMLLEYKEQAEKQGGEYLKAWQEQIDTINSLFL